MSIETSCIYSGHDLYTRETTGRTRLRFSSAGWLNARYLTDCKQCSYECDIPEEKEFWVNKSCRVAASEPFPLSAEGVPSLFHLRLGSLLPARQIEAQAASAEMY